MADIRSDRDVPITKKVERPDWMAWPSAPA
jgi:hypothetical protein